MNTSGEIKSEVLVRLQASSTIAFHTEAMLDDWLDMAHKRAAGYKPWPFTEGRVSTTYASSREEWEFEGYRADSIHFVTIDDEPFQKINFRHYKKYRKDQSDGEDKIFTDFGNLVHINPSNGLTGTLIAYGQFVPANIDDTDPDAQTIFSNRHPDGNEALVEMMMGYAKQRERKPRQEWAAHLQNAKDILDLIWEQVAREQADYHSHEQGMWGRFDAVNGTMDDEQNRRLQWY